MPVFQKGLISTMQGFQAILVLNICQCSQRHSFCKHARVSNNISTQCMSVFQRHSLVTCQGFKHYYLLNVCQCCKGTHQYHARVIKLYQYSNVCQCSKGTRQYHASVFKTILVLNVCQCSKGTHQYNARLQTILVTQCMAVFQRHFISTMQGFQNTYLVLK